MRYALDIKFPHMIWSWPKIIRTCTVLLLNSLKSLIWQAHDTSIRSLSSRFIPCLADVVRIPPARAVLLYNTCKSPIPVPIRKYLVSQRSLLALSCRATTARVYTPSLSSQAKCSRTPTTRPERWRIRCESVLPITICDCWAKSIGCFELKRRDQRDSFSLLVLCKNKKGWKVWNFAGKVTVVDWGFIIHRSI